MQVVLALLLWIAITVLRDVLPFFSDLSNSYRQRRTKHEDDGSRSKIKLHLDYLITAAIEFHKAQCYFMIAVQMACLITVNQDLRYLASKNLQQIFNNFRVIRILCYGGSIPTTFILYQLRMSGHISREIVTVTTLTILICSANTFSISTRHAQDYAAFASITRGPSLPRCGLANPTAYCYDSVEDPKSIYSSNVLNYISAEIFAIAMTFLVFLTARESWLPALLKDVEHVMWQYSNTPEALNREVRGHAGTILITVFHLIIHAWYAMYFAAYLSALSFFSPFEQSTQVSRRWTFGQIIAVVVFIPPIISYLSFLLRE